VTEVTDRRRFERHTRPAPSAASEGKGEDQPYKSTENHPTCLAAPPVPLALCNTLLGNKLMAPPSVLITVQQLVGRLENATSSERLDALQELQMLARAEARLVGEYALQKVLDFLKDQGSSEEYQEALDLIDRLIKNRDKDAALANTDIVLASSSNVELLLDLLEHRDATVGVMTSQILTEVHARAPKKLEATIQECPAGA